MHGLSDGLNELCNFEAVVWGSEGARQRAYARHEAYHERKSAEAVVVAAVLHKATAQGFSALTERETAIIRAYSVGADLAVEG